MTRERFRALVSDAIDGIPRRFAQAIDNVAIVVEDAAPPDLLAELEMGVPHSGQGCRAIGTPGGSVAAHAENGTTFSSGSARKSTSGPLGAVCGHRGSDERFTTPPNLAF